jgi:hypothetical protein
MRALADADRIRRFMRALGEAADAPARVYFTGGATAVLIGWRPSTIDVDIRVEPDRDAIFRAIARLKDELQINVELASPPDFIPIKDGWQDRSPWVANEGPLTFHHFDLYAQALAKIERGHQQDLADVREMLARGLIDARESWAYFTAIEPQLYRYPAVDPASFRNGVGQMFGPPAR